MSIITEVEALFKVIPQIEKVIADAKSAEQTPQVQSFITDLENIVSEVRSAVDIPAPTPVVS